MSLTAASPFQTDEELEREFERLVQEWRGSIRPSTRLSALLAHPAHQQIILLGQQEPSRIVPLILAQLQREPKHWFAALRSITGEDPAAEETTFSGCREAWLRWGRGQGLLE